MEYGSESQEREENNINSKKTLIRCQKNMESVLKGLI